MHANKAVCGFHLGYLNDDQLIFQTLGKLLELYNQGKIKPRIDSTYHFEQVGWRVMRLVCVSVCLHACRNVLLGTGCTLLSMH